MATEFRNSDGQFACLRWYGGRDRGTCLEFLTRGQRERTWARALAGETFEALTGETLDLGDLLEFAARDAQTLGEMAATLSFDEAADLFAEMLTE